MARTLLTCAVLTALSFTASAKAQEAEADAEERLDRYQVEVILFAYRDATPEGEDLSAWQQMRDPDVADTADTADMTDMIETLENPALELEPTEPPIEITFDPVPRDALALGPEAERLAGISAYRVLAHGAWQQLGVSQEDAQPFPVSRLRTSGGVTGSMTLHVRRFPHLALELELPPTGGAGNRMLLKESRRLRRGELHYFDHPGFGALVQITRIEAPEETSAG